jgi:hypothetical protein
MMGAAPYFFQGTHGGICRGNSCGDVIVVAQVVGDEQTQVSKSPCEADKAVGRLEGLCLVQLVIHFMLAFCLPLVVLFVVVGGVDLASSIGMVCC